MAKGTDFEALRKECEAIEYADIRTAALAHLDAAAGHLQTVRVWMDTAGQRATAARQQARQLAELEAESKRLREEAATAVEMTEPAVTGQTAEEKVTTS